MRVTGLDNFQQEVEGEEFVTRDLRTNPMNWGENQRMGDGPMGITVLAGLRVSVETGKGEVLGEGVLPLDGVLNRMQDGKSDAVVRLEGMDGKSTVETEKLWDVVDLFDLQGTDGNGGTRIFRSGPAGSGKKHVKRRHYGDQIQTCCCESRQQCPDLRRRDAGHFDNGKHSRADSTPARMRNRSDTRFVRCRSFREKHPEKQQETGCRIRKAAFLSCRTGAADQQLLRAFQPSRNNVRAGPYH